MIVTAFNATVATAKMPNTDSQANTQMQKITGKVKLPFVAVND